MEMTTRLDRQDVVRFSLQAVKSKDIKLAEMAKELGCSRQWLGRFLVSEKEFSEDLLLKSEELARKYNCWLPDLFREPATVFWEDIANDLETLATFLRAGYPAENKTERFSDIVGFCARTIEAFYPHGNRHP